MRRSVPDLALGVALGLAASSPDPVRRVAHNSIHHLPKAVETLTGAFGCSNSSHKHCVRMQTLSL